MPSTKQISSSSVNIMEHHFLRSQLMQLYVLLYYYTIAEINEHEFQTFF